MLNTIMQNIYTLGFIASIVCILASVFYKYVSVFIPALNAFPFGKTLLLAFGIVLAVGCSYKLGVIAQKKTFASEVKLEQAKIDVKEQMAGIVTNGIQTDVTNAVAGNSVITKTQIQKIYVDREIINKDCKISNTTIDALNNAIVK